MKTKEETPEQQDTIRTEKELDEKELNTVAGGVARRTTGPGTQTEDDVYVG
jgi:bacteriocin-like protein